MKQRFESIDFDEDEDDEDEGSLAFGQGRTDGGGGGGLKMLNFAGRPLWMPPNTYV